MIFIYDSEWPITAIVPGTQYVVKISNKGIVHLLDLGEIFAIGKFDSIEQASNLIKDFVCYAFNLRKMGNRYPLITYNNGFNYEIGRFGIEKTITL